MGGGRWDSSDWAKYASTKSYSTRSTSGAGGIYSGSSMHKDLDPHGVSVRESRDSADNPNSNAIIVGLDVTGSMGMIADVIARQGLDTLLKEIYDRKPVTDPHVMIMGIGDVEMHDTAPLQITQFEADIRLAEQLEKIYLEHGGGGNHYESYALVWYFAAMFTSIDCWEKRQKKGYLFTIGDENPTPYLKANDIFTVTGTTPQSDLKVDELFTMASRQYDVYHIMIEEGNHMRFHPDEVISKWTELLGQRAIRLSDHTKLAELIVSLIQMNEGTDKAKVISSWDGSTSVVIANAINALEASRSMGDGVVRF